MEDSAILDAYLAAPRKRAALLRLVDADPERLDSLQRAAVRRYANATMTLTELKLFAHDLAAICPGEAGQRLSLGLASTRECCVRNANVEARELLQGWLAE